MSSLADNQLAQLDNLIYYISNDPRIEEQLKNGTSVGVIVHECLGSVETFDKFVGGELPAKMSEQEWKNMLGAIADDETLCSYKIQNYVNDPEKQSDTYNFCAATFVSQDNSDANVIFRGTNGDLSEWTDNGAGGYSTDTRYQEEAVSYINGLPFEGNITVSGHSKGGNLSMYAAIMSDRVGRCVAIDGQGFSEEFARKYTAQIGMNRDKITLISAEFDYVNPLLYTIAGTCKFIETEEPTPKFFGYHKPNILLDSNGKLRREVSASWVTSLVQDFTSYANSCIPDPQLQRAIDDLTSLLATDKWIPGKIVSAIDGACGLTPYLIDYYFVWRHKKDDAEDQQAQFLEDHNFENEDAIKEYLREHTGDEKPQYLVRGALLRCRHGTHARRLNLLLDHAVYVRGCPMIHEFNCETVDEKNITWFGVCQSPCPPKTNIVLLTSDPPRDSSGEPIGEAHGTVEGRKCEPFIVSYQWKDTYPKTRIIDNGKLNPGDRDAAKTDGTGKGEASVTTLSFLVCNWGGLIEPYTSGQELADQEAECGQGDCDNCSQSSDPHAH